ncbi:hypothetical protein ET495_08100 [Xylanimonas allomyrinae]|uniref:Bacterial Ig-like domain-containing protein n=1 Tax=Xylanimonas allomyrinae TaxID=2509459 RepID=A0A4P6EYS0_9MICO|nr:hypothetical protein [Xylanimonas allomyrinae]QAY63208.1 hypothetical protein ET495_08100 [Xylanimonas allomyrinae]
MSHHVSIRWRAASAATFAALVAGLLAAVAPSAAADDKAVGPGWNAIATAGGAEVTYTLPDTLPIIDDAPTLVVNGTPVPATESADGTTLSATVPLAVSDVDSVSFAWTSGETVIDKTSPEAVAERSAKAAPAASTAAAPSTAVLEAAAADGAEVGPYSYTVDDYDFGDQAIDLAAIGGIRGELTGRIYLPTAGGARPVVILLHGRHTSCSTLVSGTQNPNRWPCVGGQTEVPSYKGYDGTGETLASQGYAVVSISANAINANDNQLAADNGAEARGQLVLDTLSFLQKATEGKVVSFHDDALDRDMTLDDALDAPQADLGSTDPNTLDASGLIGRLDFSSIGLMGHSRGGEGVVSAVELNQALDKPFSIKSVLPLAPVDFGRMTVANTPMLLILPYCDGDVSNQQGQHFVDDSRYAFDQSVLISTVWVMGANHNFFNSVWTPGKYGYSTSDDWGATSTDSYCGPRSSTNQRLTADEQYDVGTSLMSAWFRLTLGGDDDLMSAFDGSTPQTPIPSVPTADVRTVGFAPTASRVDLEPFTTASATTTASGSASYVTCASAGGRTLPQDLPACATAISGVRSTSGMPHWTPASFAPNVPASPMGEFTWTSTSDAGLTVTLPGQQKNASKYDYLTFKTAPEENVVSGTDLVVTVKDTSGKSWSAPVSELNPLAVQRMPKSTSTTLNKIVLQQVSIPITSLTGVDTKKLASVTFSGGVGADGTESGGVYLSDLAYSSYSVGDTLATGTPWTMKKEPTINVDATFLEEGSGPSTKQVAVYLSKPSNHETSAWFSLVGSTASSAKAGLALQKVTFAKGETCKAIDIPTNGDTTASSSTLTTYKMSVSQNEGVIAGKSAVTFLTVREDDGMTGSATPAPAVGVQGDACAEALAKSQTFPLSVTTSKPALGSTVTVKATGYRAGEAVTFTVDDVASTVAADGSGAATSPVVVSTSRVAVTAVGAGSSRTSTATITAK